MTSSFSGARASISIRIAIPYKYFESDNADGFGLLDRVLEWSREAGLSVVIDMHAAPGGQTGANMGQLGLSVALRQPRSATALNHYLEADRSPRSRLGDGAGLRPLNEGIPHFPELRKYNPQLETLCQRIVAAMREVDKNHVVIVGGARWKTNFSVFGPPFDLNVMYTFHKCGMPPEQKGIQQHVDFRESHRVPIGMSESGENTDEWITQYRELLDNNHIDWAFWPYEKMDSPRSVVSFPRPAYWDAIVAYAKLPGTMGDTEKHIAKRPPQEHINAAFAELPGQHSVQQVRRERRVFKSSGTEMELAPSSAQPLRVVRCAVKLRAGFVKFELSVLGDFGCLAQQRSAL